MNEEEWEQDKEDFFNKIEAICMEFNVTISHEDNHGAFIIESRYDHEDMKWFRNAQFYDEGKYD